MDDKIDLKKLIELVFTNPPKPPCSINLDIPDNMINLFKKTLNILMYILIEGAKILYGKNIKPLDITIEKFAILQEYMNSIGYVIKYNYDNDENDMPIKVNIWFVKYVHQTTCNGRML